MCSMKLVFKKFVYLGVMGSIHFGKTLQLPKGGRGLNGILPTDSLLTE